VSSNHSSFKVRRSEVKPARRTNVEKDSVSYFPACKKTRNLEVFLTTENESFFIFRKIYDKIVTKVNYKERND